MNQQHFHDPGALNHRVTLKAPIEVPDGCGGLDTTFEPAATVWASLSPKREVVEQDAQQARETITHLITVRYRDDLASGWRIVMGARVFDVKTVHDPDERKRYLRCSTEEQGR